MFKGKIYVISVTALCALLISCGGGSSDSASDSVVNAMDTEQASNVEDTDIVSETVLTGVFVDSAVEGASYTTPTQSGVTNSAGEFNYLAGEQVTFSIGATQLPMVTAAAQISPVDIAVNSSNPSATTINVARLLQSIDEDDDPDNGITIPTTAALNSMNLNFDVSTEAFSNDPDVINLVANSGNNTTELISAEEAVTHLESVIGPIPDTSALNENQSTNSDETTALPLNQIAANTRIREGFSLYANGVTAGFEDVATTDSNFRFEGCNANDTFTLSRGIDSNLLPNVNLAVPAGTCIRLVFPELPPTPSNSPLINEEINIEVSTADNTAPTTVENIPVGPSPFEDRFLLMPLIESTITFNNDVLVSGYFGIREYNFSDTEAINLGLERSTNTISYIWLVRADYCSLRPNSVLFDCPGD